MSEFFFWRVASKKKEPCEIFLLLPNITNAAALNKIVRYSRYRCTKRNLVFRSCQTCWPRHFFFSFFEQWKSVPLTPLWHGMSVLLSVLWYQILARIFVFRITRIYYYFFFFTMDGVEIFHYFELFRLFLFFFYSERRVLLSLATYNSNQFILNITRTTGNNIHILLLLCVCVCVSVDTFLGLSRCSYSMVCVLCL